MQEEIKKKCDEIRDLLLEKNIAYGNSVFDKGLLFEVDPMYAIQARINDKLNRIKSKETYMSENDLMDVTGYFILLQVLRSKMDDRVNEAIKSSEVIENPFDNKPLSKSSNWTIYGPDEEGTPI
tara:strand:- start:265 stop:636 length:372 start_codon:yes stop_codon:yes gene_type:complete